jgi:hypothetical protein
MREKVNTKFLNSLFLACIASALIWIAFFYCIVLFGPFALLGFIGIVGLIAIFFLFIQYLNDEKR